MGIKNFFVEEIEEGKKRKRDWPLIIFVSIFLLLILSGIFNDNLGFAGQLGGYFLWIWIIFWLIFWLTKCVVKNTKELFKSFFILGLVSISILFIFVYCDYFYNYTNKDGALQFSYIALFISILTLFALGTFEFYTKYYETNKSLKINRYKLEMLMQEIATNQDILNNVFLKNKEVTLKNKIKEKKSVYSILASGFLTTSLKDILENIY